GGLAVERKLSDRFSAVIGLRYHQLASNIKTGNKVALNTRVFVDGETRDIGYFYHNGDENLYTNRYHFVHLPVTVKWKMNKGNKTPLYLEGGGAVGKLISTNGLHFSAVDGIYYRNHRLYNDYQFSLNGGLNVELLSNARFPVSLGPVFHYHLTRNRRPAEFNNQYLSFLGLKGTVHLNLR
ncbi:MAG TPA: outer membrane beta-barrel protein, partial [Parasegetibacter sp.]